MLQKLLATRMTTTTVCAAAALVASLVGIGMATAEGVVTELKFTNNASIKISVKVDKIGYREDIDSGSTVTVPSSKLQNIDPTDSGVLWEAYQADMKSADQPKSNSACDSGVVMWDLKGAATIVVRGAC
jgi:hypothetical protein